MHINKTKYFQSWNTGLFPIGRRKIQYRIQVFIYHSAAQVHLFLEFSYSLMRQWHRRGISFVID